MTSDAEPVQSVHRELDAIREACERLGSVQDDAVRMFAQRVDALARAFSDSVVGPPLTNEIPLMAGELVYEWPCALVTGGGTGLGRGLALRLAAAGVDVWIAGRRRELLEETRDIAGAEAGRVHPYPCDLRDPAACVELVEAVDGPAGAGILVNNAAGTFTALAEDVSPNGWHAVIDATLNAPFYVTSAWAKRRIRDGAGGVVLNIASATTDGGSPGTVHSGAAKSGLISMTKTLAAEWARFGIRVNALSPGPFETSGAADWIWTDKAIRERVVSAVPLGYIAPVDEVVDPALFFLSKAARYATGSVLKLDGGWTLTDWLYIRPNDQKTK